MRYLTKTTYFIYSNAMLAGWARKVHIVNVDYCITLYLRTSILLLLFICCLTEDEPIINKQHLLHSSSSLSFSLVYNRIRRGRITHRVASGGGGLNSTSLLTVVS